MGSLDVASFSPIVAALVPMAIAWAGFATLPRVLDLISVGSESAAARGVNVERTERVALVSASLATGAAVSLAGPVSFVGIIVPHLVRLIVGADHRLVLPASALFGAAFLIGCDLVARTIIAPLELPVGIVTAIIGGPVFLMAAVPPRMKLVRVDRARRPCRLAASLEAAGAGAQSAEGPRRIISLVPATTEMLFAMGAGDRVAGVSNYDRFPPEVARLPRVGGLLDPDVERVLSLKPDLVIVYDTQTDLKRQLERARIPIFGYRHRDLRDITETMRALGARIGARAAADAAASRIEQQLAAIGTPRRRPAEAENAARLRAGAGHAAPHQRERRLRIPPRRPRARRRRQRARRSARSRRST